MNSVQTCTTKSTYVNSDTVNSLMFAGINVCVLEANTCSWGLIVAVISVPVSYLGTSIVCGVLNLAISRLSRNSPNKSIANINEFTVSMTYADYLIWLIFII